MARGKARTKQEKEEIIRTLSPYFEMGLSVAKAAKLANISPSTVHDIVNSDELLRMKIEAMQGILMAQARKNIADEIMKKKNIKLSQWFIERYEKVEPEKDEDLEKKQHQEMVNLVIERASAFADRYKGVSNYPKS